MKPNKIILNHGGGLQDIINLQQRMINREQTILNDEWYRLKNYYKAIGYLL
mgnify:CR=1 FL=1